MESLLTAIFDQVSNFFNILKNVALSSIKMQKYRISNLKLLYKTVKKDEQHEPNKLLSTELFYKLYKLNLNFDQIEALHYDNDAFQVIQFLKKFPYILEYTDGKLCYSRENQTKINELSKYISKAFNIILIVYVIYFTQLSHIKPNSF